MKKLKLMLVPLAAGAALLPAKADIIINEVMQSNVYCIMDDIKEFPDSWVELYNNGETSVDLTGYLIGLKKDPAKAYALPAIHIAAGGYQLIYCDKVGEGKHTDFRVDSGKGDLYLFDKDGNQIDHLSMKKQPAPDIAYGRESDGSDTWGYQLTPTPGKANVGGITSTVLGDVKFSVPGGVWSASKTISLELSLPDDAPEGAKIYYTTDGSEPTKSSNLYKRKLSISTGTVVRAKAFADGCVSAPSTAHSYLSLGREVKIPVISIAINDEYLNDKKIGIFSKGESYVEPNPWDWGWGGNNWNEEDANYFQDWRRPCNIEYFVAEGDEAVINQLGETRVQGGYTRRNALKSMAMYANKRFGTKRFEYEFWAKDKPGITDNKSFILRNGGNDFGGCYIRDGLIQRLIGRNTEIDWQGYTPAVVFINGQYHAMLAIRERSNEDNIAANYNGLEDVDMFENWWEYKEGDPAAIDEFRDFISQPHSFNAWNDFLNIESYTNLMALNYYIYNTDFPHNNVVLWRRTDGVDPRWRWLVKDCDFGFGIYDGNKNDVAKDYAKFLNNNPDNQESTGYDLWRQLMKNPTFKAYFIDHLVVYMGDFLNYDTIMQYIDEIWAENCGEQLISNQKWAGNEWWTPDVNGNINSMREWIKQRDRNMKTIMRNGWNLGTPVMVTVNNEIADEALADIKVYYDGIPLTKGRFKGYDYNERTIILEGSENSNIVGWTVQLAGKEPETFMEPVLDYDIESPLDITINAIINETGITDIKADAEHSFIYAGGHIQAKGKIDVYDIRGRHLASGLDNVNLPAPGVYIVKTADGRSSKLIW